MYFKNIILFFFVTLHFFQSQCAPPPTPEQREYIKNAVPDLLEDQVINFETIKTTFSIVADLLNKSYDQSTLNELETIEYSLEDVLTYALAFVATKNQVLTDSVEEIIADQVHQNEGIGIQKLKDVLLIIEESADSYQTFPTTVLDYIVCALKKTAYNRLFSIKDIKTYALAFAVSSDEDLMNFTESLVRLNRNGDGMGYRAFKTVIERIKQAKHIETPVPTYDDFEEACLGRKFTVNGIENMIIEKLFPL